MKRKLVSTITGLEYPFESLQEYSENGESLEVHIDGLENAKINNSENLLERFKDFIPFKLPEKDISLGEGNTPLMKSEKITKLTGVENLWLKNESQNPTWSFKDRGSITSILMALELGEKVSATISTGNMGHSMAAYGAKSGIEALVFVPHFTPKDKIYSMLIHGAKVIKIQTDNYSRAKNKVLEMCREKGIRCISGNGAIRVEGYKLLAFELYEQMNYEVPDFIAIPTSTCGHIRGVFKGYRELFEAGIIQKLPKMIIVQAENNSPIVSAMKQGKNEIIPFKNFHTIAEAITTGEPKGAEEIIKKTYEYEWLAESVTEEEIAEGQKELAKAGYFVEPASATSTFAIKKLREQGRIQPDDSVVMVLTGSGLKDIEVLNRYELQAKEIAEEDLDNISVI